MLSWPAGASVAGCRYYLQRFPHGHELGSETAADRTGHRAYLHPFVQWVEQITAPAPPLAMSPDAEPSGQIVVSASAAGGGPRR